CSCRGRVSVTSPLLFFLFFLFSFRCNPYLHSFPTRRSSDLDLVELFAGDTFCYDAEANKDKLEREIAAAEKLYGMIDEEKGQELRALWDEFEEMETPEALFATAMDRLQPILNNYYNDGGTWKRFEVPKSKIYERVAPIRKSSEKLWRFAEYMIEDAYDKGKIIAE